MYRISLGSPAHAWSLLSPDNAGPNVSDGVITHEGELDKARSAGDRLAALEAAAVQAGEALFARIIRVLGLTLGAYRRALDYYPQRFNSLLGAARAALDSGDEVLAGDLYRELLVVAEGGVREPALGEARAFVSQHP